MNAIDLGGAMRRLLQHRLRSALALIGIVLGTGSLVLLVGLLAGGRAAIQNAAQEANEKDLIVVHEDAPRLDQQHRPARSLSRRDASALAQASGLSGAFVSAEQRHTAWARHRGQDKRVTVVSANPQTAALYRLKLASGRWLDQSDLDFARQVCVVGQEVWRDLIQSGGALGARLIIDHAPCSVVGVLEHKPILGGTSDTDVWNRKVMLPETLFDALYNPRHRADKLIIRPRTAPAAAAVEPLRAFAHGLLLRLHLGVENFKLNPAQGHEQERLVAGILYVFMFGAVLVSLLVGGINVMNVLLVSVTERTREIGIRRALGASPRDIRWQFLTEAMLLTGAGGAIGVLGGAATCALAALVLRSLVGGWVLQIEPWSIVVGLVMSVLVGLVFGTYPAARAARLVITEALRRE